MAKSIEQSFKDGYGGSKKVAKKNKHRKHDTDDSYGNPKGGKNIQNLPTSKIKA